MSMLLYSFIFNSVKNAVSPRQLLKLCKRAYNVKAEPKALRSLKAKSSRNTVQYYVDMHKVRTTGGKGGDGMISFLSAWAKEHAGPDGGDGGHGGHVIFRASYTIKGLNHCQTVNQADHGEKGYNRDCHGKNAAHLVIPVPVGTIIKNEKGMVVGDLKMDGSMFVAARGGAGGRGNKFFLTSTEQAPEIAEYGAEGESNSYLLEVRSMAHVGLIGFPNAGKSTLVRAISRARPKVAPYPFTTLHPHIGVVPYDDYEQVADLPGLIEGSHKNYGLGIQFLQHAERCSGLLYVIDASDEEPWKNWEILEYELKKFNNKLVDNAKYVVANKIDLPEAENNLIKINEYFRNKLEVIPVSAKNGTNIGKILKIIRSIYDDGINSAQKKSVTDSVL